MNKKLAKKINDCAKLTGSFVLRSGEISDIYFDKYQFESDPILLDEIVEELKKLIPSEVEVLAGLEMGGIPLVTLLGQKLKLPIAFIRKETKKYGTCKYVEGAELTGKNILLVEDIVSSGGELLNVIKKLKKDNIVVDKAICLIDRESGGKDSLLNEGVTLKSVFTASDIKNY